MSKRYDLVISFPPCTDLAVSGARWFVKKRLSGEQQASIEFFFKMWYYSHCTENPIGIMNGGKYMKKWFPEYYKQMIANGFLFGKNAHTQIIQPWQFGHTETKATCLWLRGLPLLHSTKVVGPPPSDLTMADKDIWHRVHRARISEDRAKIRSKTLPGTAEAMAEQWG